MKVFWSWQSDTPGNTGRHFVKKALEIAIRELKEEIEVDEPNRELHLDHDRKGVPGSPDLVNTILEKIRTTSIFIADVTPVGQTANGKTLINSNVAIELGYALANIGDRGLLMVLNGHYGSRDSLPFDLKQKAGPIIFSLKPDASKAEGLKEQQSLSGQFKVAIRECVAALKKKTKSSMSEHDEIKSTSNSAVYFNNDEVLTERTYENKLLQVAYRSFPLLYLRLIPGLAVSPLMRAEIKDIIYGIKICPLRKNVGSGASWETNRFGGLTFSYEERTDGNNYFTSSQVFTNREIWGIDATLLSNGKYIPSKAFENLYESAVHHYLEVAKNLLNLTTPLIIEAGATGVKNFTMAMPYDQYWGPIYDNEIKLRRKLESFNGAEVEALLLAIFEKFFDATGERRPEKHRGFPSGK
jgi:hypothetical protein